ncbi:MAG: hypothetical protein U9R15_19790 [Chloroflexota bacterium]|nr:hypothetical protein [Chloroflexota bacterium]
MYDDEKRVKVQTVEEMFARYPDEWIFFEVMEEDEYERPTRGIMLAHHPDRASVDKIALQSDVQHSATFYSGPIVPKGSEVLPWLIATPSLA